VAKFSWRDKIAQFWNATVGKLVPRWQVNRWVTASIAAVPVGDWADQLAAGTLDVGTWQDQMRGEIKREILRQYLIGRGGLDNMSPLDYGSCGGMCGDQFRYLDNFAKEIAAGNLTKGQIRRRSEMYINSAREAFERAKERAAAEAGLNEVRWFLDPSPEVEHCHGNPGCVELSEMGWQKADPWPFRKGREKLYCGSGGTPCLTSCRCFTGWRRSKERKR
jgi:hypothetical protein